MEESWWNLLEDFKIWINEIDCRDDMMSTHASIPKVELEFRNVVNHSYLTSRGFKDPEECAALYSYNKFPGVQATSKDIWWLILCCLQKALDLQVKSFL